MQPVIRLENVSKSYRLGQIGTGSLTDDLKIWWARVRGQPDPFSPVDLVERVNQVDRVDQEKGRNKDGETIWALKDVNLQVGQGEALGVIGRNGAGKSTLLKVLSRVTAPTCGEIKIKGRIASLLEIGTGFHPELTGRENIYLNGAIMGMSAKEVRRKFDEIVEFADVAKFIDTPTKRYSSGMWVRLAFAVAAHLDPEILLVDEVLAVGDAEFQKKCLGKMGKVTQEGRTVLFVSHNMASIQTLCDRCVLLESGRVAKLGAADEVIGEYLSRRSAEANTFDGLVRQVLLVDENETPAGYVKTGQALCFRLCLDTGERELKTPVIRLGVNNTLSQRIFTAATHLSESTLPPLKGRATVACKISSTSLAPGEYFVKIMLGENLHENIEVIENALSFTVEATDFFGTGKLPGPAQGVVLAKSEWILK